MRWASSLLCSSVRATATAAAAAVTAAAAAAASVARLLRLGTDGIEGDVGVSNTMLEEMDRLERGTDGKVSLFEFEVESSGCGNARVRCGTVGDGALSSSSSESECMI